MPYDRDRPVNVDILEAPPTQRAFGRSGKMEEQAAGSYAFDVKDLGFNALHTAPFEVGTIRNGYKRLRPWNSMTDLRRAHQQGSLPVSLLNTNVCGSASLAAIPHYGGHIQGKVAENVHAKTYMRANEIAAEAVDNRNPVDMDEWRQTTAVKKNDTRQWEDRAHQAFLKETSGMAYREPHHHRMKYAEDLRDKHDELKEKMYKTTYHTWAGNMPRHSRAHANWKHYHVLGYGGHYPQWEIDEDFYHKQELGKVHPPYNPTVRYTNSTKFPFPFGPSSMEGQPYPAGPSHPSTFYNDTPRSGRSRSSSQKPIGSGRGPLGSSRPREGPRGLQA
jgi:hypothetical protein